MMDTDDVAVIYMEDLIATMIVMMRDSIAKRLELPKALTHQRLYE